MNRAYKHLGAKLRIAELTIRQWLGILVGVMTAFFYGDFVHPLGTMFTMVTAVYIGGIPIAVVLVAGLSDFDAWLVLRSALRWRSTDERYLPGAGEVTQGYHVLPSPDEVRRADRAPLEELDLGRLWVVER